MFGPTRGFSGMANSMEPCIMLWADPCCHGNEISARRGDPVAYWLVKPAVGKLFGVEGWMSPDKCAASRTGKFYVKDQISNVFEQ